MTYRWNPLDHADVYRDLAQRDRNNGRGGSAFKPITRTAALEAARFRSEPGTWAAFADELRHRWEFAVSEARIQYDWDTRLSHILGGDNGTL